MNHAYGFGTGRHYTHEDKRVDFEEPCEDWRIDREEATKGGSL